MHRTENPRPSKTRAFSRTLAPSSAPTRRSPSLGEPQAIRRRRLVTAAALTAGLLMASVAWGQPYVVNSFTPTQGSEGTTVDVFGGVFSTDPADHAVFIDDGTGLGVVLDGNFSTPGQWNGTLGPVAAPFLGELTVWWGQSYAQAPSLYAGSAGDAYWIDQAKWFIPRRASAKGPYLFQVQSGSSGTIGGLIEAHSFVIDLSPLYGGGQQRIDLDVMIDGGNSDGNPGGNGEGRMMQFGMAIIEGMPQAEVLAQDLAGALEASFSALGVKTHANGTRVHISFVNYPQARGFAVLSASP